MTKRVLRFTASWCQPCKMLSKILEDVNTGTPVEVVDIDERPETAVEFGIRGVPTLVMVEEGAVTKRLVGVKTVQELEAFIND